MDHIKIHPAANLFPMLAESDMQSLAADISANGLREPIVLHEGAILDGRNRWTACGIAGVEPSFETWDGDDPIAYVISMNLERRHLSSDQRACIAVEAESLMERERAAAKGRQRASGGGTGRRGGDKRTVPEKIPEAIGESKERVANLFRTNRRYIDQAESLRTDDPETFERVKSGEKKLVHVARERKEARREARRAENRKKVSKAGDPLKSGVRFATIVIDPPWDWGDEGDCDQLGRARPTYGTMSIDEIAALPVAKLSDDDCHLYLWITNRSLPKGFGLLDAWGFRYVTCLTWCKPAFGMGNYFRGSTEQILFGVKGSQPLKRKDVGTWFQAQRGAGGHSSKPNEFYGLVESCSPGPYLEMFARQDRHGWHSWGADV